MHRKVNRLLKKHLNSQSKSQEAKVIEQWLAETAEENEEWQGMDHSSRKEWLASLFADIQRTIYVKENNYRVARTIKLRWAASIAAVLLLVSGIYLGRNVLDQWIADDSYNQIAVGPGKVKDLLLADGTRVWLNSSSKLRYPKQFNEKNREVYLEGEGYFDVTHNAERPFIVHTGSLKTKVLGTTFNITAYKKNPELKVVLLTGKVEIMKGTSPQVGNSMTLLPKQRATYSKNGNSLVKSTVVHTDQYSAWKHGKLVFIATPMPEVLERLSTTYNINFVLTDKKVNRYRITGTFNVTEKIDDILKSISISIGSRYERRANTVTIRG